MARERVLEVCVLNIALTRQQGSTPAPDDYHRLIRAAFLAKRLVGLRGDRRGLLEHVDKQAEGGLVSGVVATYTDFDIDDSWINTSSGKAASDADLERIQIPEGLRPHHRRYNFRFDLSTHKLVIETRSEPETGKNRLGLTPGTAASLFESLFYTEEIIEKFGPVGVTVLPHQEGVEQIINWGRAERIEIRIKPPNPDDEDLEERIERRMASMNVSRWDQDFRASEDNALSPDDELKASMRVAARNGHVLAVGYEQGQRLELSTKDVPLLVDGSYDPAAELHFDAFKRTADDAIAQAQGKKAAQKPSKKRRRKR